MKQAYPDTNIAVTN